MKNCHNAERYCYHTAKAQYCSQARATWLSTTSWCPNSDQLYYQVKSIILGKVKNQGKKISSDYFENINITVSV